MKPISIKVIFALVAVSITLTTTAHAREIKPMPAEQYNSTSAEAMDPTSIYFTYTFDPGTFTEWKTNTPVEAEYLSLWRGYEEPIYPSISGTGTVQKKLTIFVAKAKSVINKASGQINYSAMIQLDFLKNLNNEFTHQQINTDQVISLVAGRGPVTSFQWCNPNGDSSIFFRAQTETNLSMLNPPDRTWCSDQNSICLESCYTFSMGWQTALQMANLAEEDSDKKDYGMAMQSEVRYFLSEQELGMNNPVSSLTGLNTKVTGVLRQNIFYVNQVIQFGTITAIFQEHPTDPNKTVVNSYFTFTVSSATWNGHGGKVKEIMLGNGGMLNTSSGITAGLPVFTQNLATQLTNYLEAN